MRVSYISCHVAVVVTLHVGTECTCTNKTLNSIVVVKLGGCFNMGSSLYIQFTSVVEETCYVTLHVPRVASDGFCSTGVVK